MTADSAPIALERQVHFDSRHPAAVQLETTLPGQTLLIGMRAGQHLRAHRVNTPITIQVVRGEGELTAGEQTYPARPGTLLPLAANVVHGATAETDLVLLVYRAAVAEAEVVEPERRPAADAVPPALDVREIPPRERHARIFALFDTLQPGESFRLINDHNPKPLKYQFAVERAGEVRWEPEREGPDVWIIRISKEAEGGESQERPANNATARALDVREIPPRERHPRIFAAFDALQPGESFRLINDHDPRPLKYQFLAERAGEVQWEPEREGPDAWIIRIRKTAASA